MLPQSIQNLINQLSKLPGIGPKSAARLTFYLLSKPESDLNMLGQSILNLKHELTFCKECFTISDTEVCKICSDHQRNKSVLTVVEEPLDLMALERSYSLSSRYHVLGGSISPIEGIGPDNLRIRELLERLKKEPIEELILATNPDLEGEATAAYIKDKVSGLGLNIRITRIARGLPVGGDLEYADEITLKRSLEGRREY